MMAMQPNSDHADTDARLRNWARWCYSGGGAPRRCGSAEGRFVPIRADDEKLERTAQEPIDPVDAERIEKCVTLTMDRRTRQFVTLYYLKRRRQEEIARKLRFDRDCFLAELDRTLIAVEGALKRPTPDRRMARRMVVSRGVLLPVGWRE